jgi:phage baseplate assembly protein gpV
VNERRDELSAQHDRLRWQIAASEQVIVLLIDGHLTLAAAVDQLVQINQNRPGFADGLAYLHQDAPTHRLRLARYALAKAEVRLSADQVRRTDVAARLTTEYQAMGGPAPAPAESPPPTAVAMGGEDD